LFNGKFESGYKSSFTRDQVNEINALGKPGTEFVQSVTNKYLKCGPLSMQVNPPARIIDFT